MRVILQVSFYMPVILLLSACDPSARQREEIEKRAAKNDPYALAVKIGEYVHNHPEEMDHLPDYARLLLENGYYEECIHLCNQILQHVPGDYFTMHTLAMANYQLLDLDKSLALYRKIMTEPQVNPLIEKDYRQTLIQNELYDQVKSLDSAIGVTGLKYDLVLQRAGLFLKMNEGKAAMADYALYLDSAGYDRDVAFNRFRAAILSTWPNEAEKEIQRISKQSNPEDSLNQRLTKILADTRAGIAAIKTTPESPKGYELMAKSLVFLKLEPEAIPYLEKAFTLDKENISLRLRLAYVYAHTGSKDEARILVEPLILQGKTIPAQIRKMLE